MIQHKSKFDLEPNPFERSFATKESSSLSLNELANDTTTNNNNDTNSEINSIASTSAISSSTKNNGNSSNKHNLHIPNISTINQQSSDGGSGNYQVLHRRYLPLAEEGYLQSDYLLVEALLNNIRVD